MKLLIKLLLSFCCLLLGVHAHTTQESSDSFPRQYYTLSAEHVHSLQASQAYVSQRRSTGDRQVNNESAEKEEESDDEDDDEETKSSKRHTASGSNYITSNSTSATANALYVLSHFSSLGHLSYLSSSRFIIHCVFRL